MKNRQAIIAEVGATIASALTLDEVMSTIARQVGEAFGVTSCDIHRYSPETDLLDYVASWGMAEDFSEDEAGVGESYAPELRPSFVPVVRHRQVVEMHRDDPDLPADEIPHMDRWHERSILNAPLEFGGQVIGVLGLVEADSCRYFTPQEKTLFSQLAVLAAIAINNADQFAVLDQQNRSLQSLLEASRALASTVGIDETLKVMSRTAAQALGSPACVIYELLPAKKALVLRCSFGVTAKADVTGELPLSERFGDRWALERGDIVVEQATDRSIAEGVRKAMAAAGEMTHLHVPLIFEGRPLGTLVLVETSRERRFTTYELELARGLGEHAAAALHNAGLYQSMEVEATTDFLTGLHNFRYLQTRLREETARFQRYGTPFSLLMLDVDDFKRFNDDFGHVAGDDALVLLAGILRGSVRTDIDITCRYGGEEFAVLLPNTVVDPAGAVMGDRAAKGADRSSGPRLKRLFHGERVRAEGAPSIAERIRAAVETCGDAAGAKPLPRPITVSIGVAEVSREMNAPELLVAAADKALYLAKRLGKNRVESFGEPTRAS